MTKYEKGDIPSGVVRHSGGFKGVLALILLAISIFTHAQETVYTLNQFTPLLYNPAISSADHEGSLSFFHDEYTLGAGDYVSANAFSAEYPFIRKSSGQRLLGVGLNFMERDLGRSDMLKTYNAGLSFSSNVQLAAQHSLSLGISGNYYSKRTSMENLTTGSQWIAEEFRYDPDAALGETFDQSSIQYFSVGTGLLWQWVEADRRKAFAGISAFHLNKPEEKFFEERVTVPVTFTANAGMILYENRSVALSPQVYYTRSGHVGTYRAIWSTKLLFSNTNPYDIIKSGNVDLLLNYAFARDASVGVVLNQPGFSVGFGYQFPLGGQRAYLQNGFQLGVTISRLLWKKEPQRVVIESAPQRRQIDFGTRNDVPVRQESEVEAIRGQLEALDGVRSLQFELEKDFKFEFGKAELDIAPGGFLDELAEMLKENPDFRLKVIGHTDNVGRQQINYELSVRRAQAVTDYLVARGVVPENVSVIGKGDTEPAAPNDTEENKAKNRRVEFIISVNR